MTEILKFKYCNLILKYKNFGHKLYYLNEIKNWS